MRLFENYFKLYPYIEAIVNGSKSLNIEPIIVNDEAAANLPEEAVMLESHDAEEE